MDDPEDKRPLVFFCYGGILGPYFAEKADRELIKKLREGRDDITVAPTSFALH